MKLYIVGSVGSGKSTLAGQVSKITSIPCNHLDEVVHIEDPTNPLGNVKRPIDERNMLFSNILACEQYIVEDTGRECFVEGMHQADTIVLLDIPIFIRIKRITFRWIKQNLGLEECIYKPRFAMLKCMYKWTKNYDTGADGTKNRVKEFKSKTLYLHNNKEIKKFLNSLEKQTNAY